MTDCITCEGEEQQSGGGGAGDKRDRDVVKFWILSRAVTPATPEGFRVLAWVLLRGGKAQVKEAGEEETVLLTEGEEVLRGGLVQGFP